MDISKLKRYHFYLDVFEENYSDMEEQTDGEYVLYADVATLSSVPAGEVECVVIGNLPYCPFNQRKHYADNSCTLPSGVICPKRLAGAKGEG